MAPSMERLMLSNIKEVPFIKLDDMILEFELDDPSPEFQEIAKKELRETPEIQKMSIARLQELLKAEKDLKTPLDHEAWLIRFLRPCKYYPESSLTLVKNYYNFKVKHASVYNNLKPSTAKNIFEHNILTVLPNRDQHGRRMLLVELGKKWKHNKCSLDEVYKGCVLYLEGAMIEPITQIAGGVVIFDLDGLSLQQAWQFTPPFAKRIVDLLQEAMPLRIKNIHIVNQPYVFNMVFALFKPFLNEKLKNRIIFHGTDRKSLYQYIPPAYLPSQFGGTQVLKQLSGPEWYSLLIQVDKEFDAINSYGYKKK
ncbi:PREDICTED: alpha-tocopherol transfer protein-like isoform X2 [Vollenhovia emeryi]|uniref:alpha-tocopherol transfer protein-like isoform X2 n=1 Tax=Vollenhovia emeryi TaxID=411798 RepID=UPI0005F4852B|nr:PREDICTED: alpha-tocopherol transfer protein-like isoform X2 [Vollenhovia emeryi]